MQSSTDQGMPPTSGFESPDFTRVQKILNEFKKHKYLDIFIENEITVSSCRFHIHYRLAISRQHVYNRTIYL